MSYRKMPAVFSMAAAAILLANCQSTPKPVTVSVSTGSPSATAPIQPTDPATQLENFTVQDLQNALTDAKAQPTQAGCPAGSGDCVAANCYQFLIPAVQSAKSQIGAAPSGAISAFQKARDVSHLASTGVPANLNLACAPLAFDTTQTLAKLGLVVGGGVVTGGAVTAIPLVTPIQ